jgi:hypothetical protein
VTIGLCLLTEVSYDGVPVPGARSADLLAALVAHRTGLSDARLLDEVWADHAPSPKALQVQVSRVRAQCGAGVIERYDGGYRLGLPDDAVDAWRLESLAERARKALLDDPRAALAAAGAARDLLAGVSDTAGTGPLAEVRRAASALGPAIIRTHALALARCGLDADALAGLICAHTTDPDDTEVFEALLRCEAATSGCQRRWRATRPIARAWPTGSASTPTLPCSEHTRSCSWPTTRCAAECGSTPTSCSDAPRISSVSARWSAPAG